MDATAQWADSLLGLERLFFLKLSVWSAASLVAASLLFALRARQSRPAPTLAGLASALLAIAVPLLAVALLARNGVGLRDLASATTLDRALWFASGFAIAVGLAASAWAIRAASSPQADGRAVGRALGVGLHCLAFTTFAVQLARAIVR